LKQELKLKSGLYIPKAIGSHGHIIELGIKIKRKFSKFKIFTIPPPKGTIQRWSDATFQLAVMMGAVTIYQALGRS